LASCFGQNPASNADCAKADVDEDGDIDRDDFSFVSARMGEAYPEILFHDQFPQKFGTSEWPISVTIGDVNGDAVLDVVTGNGAAIGDSKVSVLLGNGDGSFQVEQRFAVDGFPFLVALDYVNGDAVLDVVTANSNSVSVLLGNGDGTFQAQERFSVGDDTMQLIALGDINGDAVLDVLMANALYDGDMSVFLGNGDGSFLAPQSFAIDNTPESVALGDVNGDAVLDLVTINNMQPSYVSVSLGNGDGSFQVQQSFTVSSYPGFIALGYVNGDTALDLVTVSGFSNDVSVLLNRLVETPD
ncbi:MAG: VCBS repeat-containing protein, partial [Candidatus Thiodiazotropha sp.]